LNHDGIATKMHCLLRCDVDQIGNVLANGVLTVFIESSGKPNRRAIGQRAKTSVEMIKARIDQLRRDDETAEHLGDRARRLDLVLDAVVIRRAKKEFAHKMTVTYRRVEGVLLLRPPRANAESVRPTRAGSGP